MHGRGRTTALHHWNYDERNSDVELDDPIVEVAPATTEYMGGEAERAFMVMLIKVVIWVVAVRPCAEVRHTVALSERRRRCAL